VTDINGCAGKDTITVNIVDQPVIGFNTAANTPNMLDATFTNTSTGENITYLWDFGDGNSATTRDAVHSYANGGTYTVTLTVANACDTLTQTFDVAIAGVGIGDDLLANSINIFPNPTTDMININLSGLNEDVEVTVADATGRILFKDVITRFEQANTTRYDLSDEAKGVYTVMFKMGERRLARRVVLK
jgi:PKD repeat protein